MLATNETTEIVSPKKMKMDTAPRLFVKKLSDKARLPKRGSPGAAGYDLCRFGLLIAWLSRLTMVSAKDMTIPARGRAVVPTDLSIALVRSCALTPMAQLISHFFLLFTIIYNTRSDLARRYVW